MTFANRIRVALAYKDQQLALQRQLDGRAMIAAVLLALCVGLTVGATLRANSAHVPVIVVEQLAPSADAQ